MADDAEKVAMDLCDAVQLQMSGHDTNAVMLALSLLVADIAINVCPDQKTADDVVDHITSAAKEKMTRDWVEAKERLAAQKLNAQTQAQ